MHVLNPGAGEATKNGSGWAGSHLAAEGLGGKVMGGTGPGLEARLGCLSPQVGAGHQPVMGHLGRNACHNVCRPAWVGMNSQSKAGWGYRLPGPQTRTEAPNSPKDWSAQPGEQLMQEMTYSSFPVTQTGRAGPGGAEGILPVPGCWDPALEAGDCSGTQEAGLGHSFPSFQPALSRDMPRLKLEAQWEQRPGEVGQHGKAWGPALESKAIPISDSIKLSFLRKAGEEAPVWGPLQARESDSGRQWPRTWVPVHIPRQIQGQRPLLPLQRGGGGVRAVGGEGAPFALSPITGTWKSTLLVPVTLPEKQALTSDLKENPKRRECVAAPFPLPNSPGVLNPQGCRLHLGPLRGENSVATTGYDGPTPPWLLSRMPTALTAHRWGRRRGMSSVQRTPKADTGALPRQLYWTLRAPPRPPPQGGHHRPLHFCLDGSPLLPFHLFFFRDFRQAEQKVKILFLIWNLQVSCFTFRGWSCVEAFLGRLSAVPTGSQGDGKGGAPDLSPARPRPVWTGGCEGPVLPPSPPWDQPFAP